MHDSPLEILSIRSLTCSETAVTVRKILRLGDPRLRQRSAPVGAVASIELQTLVRDMQDTMAAADGAGLAAIQIGVPLRVMIFGVDSNPRYPDAEPVPGTVLINPTFEVLSEQRIGGWEGCLSVPGMRGWVSRPAQIRYAGINSEGQAIERDANGFHARVFQHEFDHLNGTLYPDRIEDRTRFGFIEELAASGAFD